MKKWLTFTREKFRNRELWVDLASPIPFLLRIGKYSHVDHLVTVKLLRILDVQWQFRCKQIPTKLITLKFHQIYGIFHFHSPFCKFGQFSSDHNLQKVLELWSMFFFRYVAEFLYAPNPENPHYLWKPQMGLQNTRIFHQINKEFHQRFENFLCMQKWSREKFMMTSLNQKWEFSMNFRQ